MGIAAGIKELTEDILSSSVERALKLAELKGETRTLRRAASDMVKDFSGSRRRTSRELRQELARSNGDRRKKVIESRNDARHMIAGFRSSREDSGTELRNDLAQSQARMKSEVRGTLAGAGALVGDCRSSRRAMGARLKADLAKIKEGLDRDRKDRKTGVAEMQASFRRARSEVRADLKEAADAWKDMDFAIHRAGAAGTMPRAIAKTPAAIAPEMKEKLLTMVNQHASGIALSDMAGMLGVATITMVKAARALLQQGRVRKEGKLYFPVAPQEDDGGE